MPSKKSEAALEQQMYEMLDTALTRAECAARAVARVEYGIVQKHLEQQQQETPTTEPEGVAKVKDPGEVEEDLAAQASREFNSSHFQTTFFNLNVLRVVEDLMELMELQHLQDDVMHTLVQDMFRPRGAAGKPARGGNDEVFIGSDADMLFHKLRKLAEKQQHGRR